MTSLRLAATAFLPLIACATPVFAGGFYLQEQSAREVGRAFSGEAASADSPATIYFNPAGMTELEGVQIEIGGEMLFVNSGQENRGTTRSIPGVTNAFPVPGGDGGNPFSQPLVVPQAYASAQMSDRLWVGLGVSSPFGVVVDYDDDFFGRYDSNRSDVFTINVQPSVAYKINDNLSIGAGFDVQYIDVELTNAVPNLSPLSGDGFLSVKGDDFSLGWNVGAQFEDDLNNDVLPAVTTLDAFATAALTDRLTMVLRGENLFDTRVVTRNQSGSIDLGAPRTIWIGLKAALPR